MDGTSFVEDCQICHYERNANPLFQTDHWTFDLAPEQGYLGHTYVYLRRHKSSLSDLTSTEWTELHTDVRRFESAFRQAFDAQVFNWVCLMNDAFKAVEPKPHVHWKVRPRYNHSVTLGGTEFVDPDFAHHYDKSRDSDQLAEPNSRLRRSIEAAIRRHDQS